MSAALSLVTRDWEPLIALVRRVIGEHIVCRAPDLNTEDVAVTADAIVRLMVSHLGLPSSIRAPGFLLAVRRLGI